MRHGGIVSQQSSAAYPSTSPENSPTDSEAAHIPRANKHAFHSQEDTSRLSAPNFKMPIPENDPRIRLLSTAYVVYNHADLSSARTFLLDFGLTIASEVPGQEIHFKGYGTEPFVYTARQSPTPNSFFSGAAYAVESRAELSRAIAIVPGCRSSSIEKLDAPGGGEVVTLTDPAGHTVYLVHGQTKIQNPTRPPCTTTHAPTNYEFAGQKPRQGVFQRFEPGPAPVHRWGHYGVTYPPGMYQDMYDWYTTYLALAPSDVVYKDGKPITCFFHIDRGLEFADHHAFFFKPAKEGMQPDVAHAAFETHDFDVQQLGHDWLKGKGYEVCWGVGRVSHLAVLMGGNKWLTGGAACARQSGIRLLVRF